MRAAARSVALSLALASCGPAVLWRVRSADRSTEVSVVERGGRQAVVVGGVALPPAEAVGVASLAVSADGATVARAERHAGRWHLAVNGSLGPPWDGVGEVALSPDGRRVAYAAERAGRWHVVVDGAEHSTHAALLVGTLRWGPRGRHVVYVARDAAGEAAVVDGVMGTSADAVRWIRFGDKDGRVAWVERAGNAERVVVDGRAGPAWERVAELALADESPRVAYVGERDGTASLVVDGEVIATSPRALTALRVSASGARVVCLRVADDAVTLLDNGRDAGRHDDVEAATLSLTRDGAHVTFVAVVDGGRAVVRDGAVGPRFEDVPELQARDDGRWAYVGHRDGAWTVVVDGRRVRRERVWAGAVALSPRGRHAFFVRRGEGMAVRDEARERPAGEAFVDSLTFDASGRRWGFLGASGPGAPLSLVAEGGARRPVDLVELGSLLAGGALDGEAVRALVRAELARRQ
ncbi:MAG: hypothetical protein U0324_04125 [Polyangiales bacterium]